MNQTQDLHVKHLFSSFLHLKIWKSSQETESLLRGFEGCCLLSNPQNPLGTVLPVKNLACTQASTALWKRSNRDIGDGRAMLHKWTRPGIHTLHWESNAGLLEDNVVREGDERSGQHRELIIWLTQHCDAWRRFVGALCSSRTEESWRWWDREWGNCKLCQGQISTTRSLKSVHDTPVQWHGNNSPCWRSNRKLSTSSTMAQRYQKILCCSFSASLCRLNIWFVHVHNWFLEANLNSLWSQRCFNTRY